MQDFSQIYSEYFSEVYRFTLSLCRDADLAEEITQESFLKALKSIDRFQGGCELNSWLCQIAKNTFYSYLKKQKKTDYPLEQISSGQDLEHCLDDRETAFAIHQALHLLKEPYKEVFWLRAFGELPFSQIGLLFGKTENWARVTYYRAKTQLKEDFK